MKLPISTDFEPMEAELAEKLPEGEGWIYEPKWDGFRCLAFRDGAKIELRSKAGKPLTRYFPDVVERLLQIAVERFVLDGEIVIPAGAGLSFDDLLLRIHPADSRVQKLAAELPAMFIAFDLLVDDEGKDLTEWPLARRRSALNSLAAKRFPENGDVRLSPSTTNAADAQRWLNAVRLGLDGVIAKRAELPYQSGNRHGMIKVKRLRTAECVVGGFRWSKNGKRIGSMLLGLYGDDGLLHHVGFCSALNEARRREAQERLVPLQGGEGFSGRAPGGPSRWRSAGEAKWEAVDPSIVIEVQYDHFISGRFRHGTKFMRWRPDKAPESCEMAQVEREGASAVGLLG